MDSIIVEFFARGVVSLLGFALIGLLAKRILGNNRNLPGFKISKNEIEALKQIKDIPEDMAAAIGVSAAIRRRGVLMRAKSGAHLPKMPVPACIFSWVLGSLIFAGTPSFVGFIEDNLAEFGQGVGFISIAVVMVAVMLLSLIVAILGIFRWVEARDSRKTDKATGEKLKKLQSSCCAKLLDGSCGQFVDEVRAANNELCSLIPFGNSLKVSPLKCIKMVLAAFEITIAQLEEMRQDLPEAAEEAWNLAVVVRNRFHD